MQSVSSRIWTRVAVSISNDDNHYTTGTSIRYQKVNIVSLDLGIWRHTGQLKARVLISLVNEIINIWYKQEIFGSLLSLEFRVLGQSAEFRDSSPLLAKEREGGRNWSRVFCLFCTDESDSVSKTQEIPSTYLSLLFRWRLYECSRQLMNFDIGNNGSVLYLRSVTPINFRDGAVSVRQWYNTRRSGHG